MASLEQDCGGECVPLDPAADPSGVAALLALDWHWEDRDRAAWPDARDPALRLAEQARQAGPLALLSADRPAADLTVPVPVLRARTILTCAPPARVPCPAGMTG